MKNRFIMSVASLFIAALITGCVADKPAEPLPLTGPIPGLTADSRYMIHYGDWEERHIRYAEKFDLAIVHPFSNITPQIVADIKDGADNLRGTDDDVWIVAYVSVGEEHPGPVREGDGRGPVTWKEGELVYKNKGAASYYLDADDDGEVDVNGTWASYYVNAGDLQWQEYLRQRDNGFDDILHNLGCDGFFLDTIDSASPWHVYQWMLPGMGQFIETLRKWYPQSIIVANRGLFYFYNDLDAYQYNIRPHVNAVMFESFYTGWDWDQNFGTVNPWFETSHKAEATPHVLRESQLPDGFNVLVLDYLNPEQPDYAPLFRNQILEVTSHPGWLNCITDKLIRSGINLTVPIMMANPGSE